MEKTLLACTNISKHWISSSITHPLTPILLWLSSIPVSRTTLSCLSYTLFPTIEIYPKKFTIPLMLLPLAIRYSTSQACQISNANKIFIVTDTIHMAKQIFDLSAHPFQIQLIKVAQSLRVFFNRDPSSTVKFWECPSKLSWPPHVTVDKEMRQHKHKFVP